jgi:hypothetical protein
LDRQIRQGCLPENTQSHALVILNTNDARTITVTVSQLSKQDLEKDFEQIGKSWCGGAIDGIRENDKLTDSKLSFKTLDGRKVAEATCIVSAKDAKFYGLCRCWRSGDRLMGWIAIGTKGPLESQKEILNITDSIKFAD